MVASRIFVPILIPKVLFGSMEITIIDPVVTISIQNQIIIIPHAMSIFNRDLRFRTNQILLDWKEIHEANTIAKWSKEQCFLMEGSDILKTSKLRFMWRTLQRISPELEI